MDHEFLVPECAACPRRSGPYLGGCGRQPLAITHLGQYQSLFGIALLLVICMQSKWNPLSHPSQTITLFVSCATSLQYPHKTGGLMYTLATLAKGTVGMLGFNNCWTASINCWCVCCCSVIGCMSTFFAPRCRAWTFGACPPPEPLITTIVCVSVVRVAGTFGGLSLTPCLDFPISVTDGVVLTVQHEARQSESSS